MKGKVMGRLNSTVKKRFQSSDNVVIIRKRPKYKPSTKAKIRPVQPKINTKNFIKKVLKDMNKLLPPPPFKIGIYYELFEALKDKYTGKRKRLRKTIKYHLKHKVESRHYLESLIREKKRTGLDGKKYNILDRHRVHASKQLKGKENDRRNKNQRGNRGYHVKK